MAETRFTESQQNAIDVHGGNILVSAAAGSGKTSVLTERAVNMLIGDNRISADRLVIATFTEAAAAEMRRRISDKLLKKIAENPYDEGLQEQQLLLAGAHISTIHAFCLSLIKENYQALGLPPTIKIGETAQIETLLEESAQEVIESAYETGDPEFLSLVEFTCVKTDRRLIEIILSIYKFIRTLPFPKTFLKRSLEKYKTAKSRFENAWADELISYIKMELEHALSAFHSAVEISSSDNAVFEKYGAILQNEERMTASALDSFCRADFAEAEKNLFTIKKERLGAVRNPECKATAEQAREKRETGYKIISELTSSFFAVSEEDFREDCKILIPKLEKLFELVCQLYDLIEEKKRQKEILDYNDMEHFALELLVTETEDGYQKTQTGHELSNYFGEIMLDECQDINEIQSLIFTALSKDGENLYMVGDIKQSIYRFRQANPNIFIEKRKRSSLFDKESHNKRSEEYITLDSNFRSRREVCSAVNFVFSQLMSEQAGEIDYTDEESLKSGASYPDYDKAFPELHILSCPESADEKSNAEGAHIARTIQSMIADGYMVTDKNGSMRPCRYKDFAILLRSKKNTAEILSAKLAELSIPSACDSSDGYFDEYEVSVIINLLRVIDNPLRDLPLLSVLMSPIFGFSPDRMAQIRISRRNAPLYSAMLSLDDEDCIKVKETIDRFRTKAAVSSISELISEIYNYTDFVAVATAMGGIEREANLRLLLSRAKSYESFGGGLSDFLRYIDRLIETGQSFSTKILPPENANIVHIMSMHSSKGLEFPICIIADCGRSFNFRDLYAAHQLHSQLGFSIKITDAKTLRRYSSLPFEAIKIKRKNEQLAEEMRILYVALTRAREKLIIVASFKDAQKSISSIAAACTGSRPSPAEVLGAGNFAAWLISAFLTHPDAAELRRLSDRNDILPQKCDFKLGVSVVNVTSATETPEIEETLPPSANEALLKQIETVINYDYPCLPMTKIPSKLTVTQIAKQKGRAEDNLTALPDFMEQQKISPAFKGTILHRFMQLSDFKAAKENLENEINRLCALEHFTAEEAAALEREEIKTFLSSPLCHRMLNCEVKREYKFNFFVKAGEVDDTLLPPFSDEEIFVQGIADCIIFENDGITIVDYKTDRTKSVQALKERYFDQLRLYKSAVSDIFDLPVKKGVIYSLYMGREIEI